MTLRIRPAERGDRSRLQGFICTEPARFDRVRKRSVHPRPWELEAQSMVRSLRPPLRWPYRLLVAEDGAVIVGVCHYQLLRDVRLGSEPVFYVRVLATSSTVKRSGVARAMLQRVLREIRTYNREHGTDFGLVALVHEGNSPCQNFIKVEGFEIISAEDGGHQLWGYLGKTP